mgnify:CR=1 FL=1
MPIRFYNPLTVSAPVSPFNVTRNAYYNVMKNPKTAAERKSKYRERLKRHGLAEYRVVIPDNAECRKTMREKAEYLSKHYVRKHAI